LFPGTRKNEVAILHRMNSQYVGWVFVEPRLAGSKESDELSINLPWDWDVSRFVDVIRVVVLYIEGAQRTFAEVA